MGSSSRGAIPRADAGSPCSIAPKFRWLEPDARRSRPGNVRLRLPSQRREGNPGGHQARRRRRLLPDQVPVSARAIGATSSAAGLTIDARRETRRARQRRLLLAFAKRLRGARLFIVVRRYRGRRRRERDAALEPLARRAGIADAPKQPWAQPPRRALAAFAAVAAHAMNNRARRQPLGECQIAGDVVAPGEFRGERHGVGRAAKKSLQSPRRHRDLIGNRPTASPRLMAAGFLHAAAMADARRTFPPRPSRITGSSQRNFGRR